MRPILGQGSIHVASVNLGVAVTTATLTDSIEVGAMVLIVMALLSMVWDRNLA